MKSFSQRTKEGLCRIESVKPCCGLAELSGIIMFAGKLKNNKIKISSECETVVKRFAFLAQRYLGDMPEIRCGKNSYYCIVASDRYVDKLFDKSDSDLSMGKDLTIPKKTADKECCRTAFLRGAFLGGGTVVDPNKNYNLEFLTHNESLCMDLESMLKKMGLEYKKAGRRSSFVVYSKNSEVICDTLTYMGAFSAQMEILNVKIERELRNDLNRVANSETANMDKVITAAIRQIRAIEKIENCIGLNSLPDDLREVAILRSKNKDLSLEQLGKKLTPQLSKSGVNHRLKKIINIADNL